MACRDKNQLFLTGDTCQTIARGVGFRFDDVRSMFYEANEEPGPWQGKIGVPEVKPLTVNYRTHTGILKCANRCLPPDPTLIRTLTLISAAWWT